MINMSSIELLIIILLLVNIVLLCVLISKTNKRNTSTNETKRINNNQDINKKTEPKNQPPIEHKKSDLDKYKPGDIVYCIMPLPEEKLKRVPEGHRQRPYLIVDKSSKALFGYYSTTHVNERIPYQQKYTYKRDLVNKNGEL